MTIWVKGVFIFCGALILLGLIGWLSGPIILSPEQKQFVLRNARERQKRADADKASRIKYLKDTRTQMCFAVPDYGPETPITTWVPCTPEVELLIGGGKL